MNNKNVELPLLKGKPKEKYIPISVGIGTLILLILALIASLAFTFKKDYKVHYSEKSNIDYKVYLKENDSFTEKYLGMNKKYIANLVDYIDTDFEYSFKIDDDLDLNYSYYIVAKLEVNDSHNKNIYEKEDIILNKKEVVNKKKEFKISHNSKIDYAKYNKLATTFIDEYKLTASANLTVSLIVNVDGKHNEFDKKLSDMEVISFKVPLSEKTVDITMDYDLVNSADKVLQKKNIILNNRTLLFVVLLFAFLDVVAIILVVRWVIVNRDPSTIYNKKFDKIKKDYSRYLSETIITERAEDLMRTRSLRIVIVKKFEDMLDIRDALNKPILFHEERPNEEAIFYIITEGIGYIYSLKASDMKYKK